MYHFFKTIGKQVLPEHVLLKYESLFRKLITLKYRGSRFECNICKTRLKKFIRYKSNDLLCPACGSQSRTRRLYSLLFELDISGKVLHFSPPKSLSERLETNSFLEYYSSDFVGEFKANYQFDITNISIQDNYFDTIICYHILEHIVDDIMAMKELYRVVKPNGFCLIQTPFKVGDTYEDDSITSNAGRERAFGQKDHVRVYSVKDLLKRLASVGFSIEILNFNSNDNTYNGFRSETILLARKK